MLLWPTSLLFLLSSSILSTASPLKRRTDEVEAEADMPLRWDYAYHNSNGEERKEILDKLMNPDVQRREVEKRGDVVFSNWLFPLLEFSLYFKTKIVPLHFHVIYSEYTAQGGYLSTRSLDLQVAVLNKAFTSTGIQFVLASYGYDYSPEWFVGVGLTKEGYSNEMEIAMKKFLRYDHGPGHINIYLVGTPIDDPLRTGGWAPYPHHYIDNPEGDGIVVQFTTLPENGVYDGGDYSTGMIMVHEMGHALGLPHTFNEPEGCDDKHGDHIADTPTEASPSWPSVLDPKIGRDTCPDQPGLDPIDNYMDYQPDSFKTKFTIGQIAHMHFWLEYARGIVA